jgi:hypothetical protein
MGCRVFDAFEDWFNMAQLKWLGFGLIAACCCIASPSLVRASDGSAAQHRAAEEYLGALAAGDASALALSIHQDDLEQLRRRLLDEMRLEADRAESLTRSRLFGSGMPLAEIERLTPQNFFVALSSRLRFGGRAFERVEWLAAVDDSGGMVQMIGRLRPARELGSVRVPVLVSIVPWGKDWKAALPLELQAQIEDLRTGRAAAPGAPAGMAAAADGATRAAAATGGGSPQAILELFKAAEDNLKAVRCEDYYTRQMSPNFRRTTAAKALRSLITACENREAMREQLLTALQLAREATPRMEYGGTRASYDLRGHGLPFPALVLEQIEKRWYIAE